MQTNPRIPADGQEVFAMAFMIGYLGWVPDELQAVFPEESFETCPEFISDDLAHEWKSGYWSGVSFFSDHALDGDE